MRWILVAFSTLALSLSCPQARAQQTDPQASSLVLRAIAALTAGTTISDVTLTGTATRIAGSENESGTAVLKALATGESRMDLSLTSGPLSEIRAKSSSGNAGGVWSGPDSAQHAMASHNLWTPPAWFFPLLVLTTAASNSSYAVSYIGQETRAGVSVQHLKLWQQLAGVDADYAALVQHLSQTEVYLDSSTLLPVAVAFNIHPDKDAGHDIPVVIRFSDYRLLNGFQVPFRVSQYIRNSLALDFQAQNAALNTGLTSAAFSLR